MGQAIATRLADLGHSVVMGARDAANETAAAWAEANGGRAGTFADAASHGEIVINATAGVHALSALAAADGGQDNLAGKVVADVTNPLDFSGGFPPVLSVANTNSLAEQIQAAFPEARVVKTLNTVTAAVMVNPDLVPGEHVLFLSGEDPAAKKTVAGLLGEFGWPAGRLIDLGGIRSARTAEMYVPLWVSLYQALGTANFNIAIVKAEAEEDEE